MVVVMVGPTVKVAAMVRVRVVFAERAAVTGPAMVMGRLGSMKD
jgi:hypothetical protein